MPRLTSKIQGKVAKLLRRPRNEVDQSDGRQLSLGAPTTQGETSLPVEARQTESEEVTTTESDVSERPVSNGSPQVTAVFQSPADLWDKAFETLRGKDGQLVKGYEKCLSEDVADSGVEASNTALTLYSKMNREEKLSSYIKRRIRIDEDSAWKVTFGSKTIALRAQVDTAVKVITFAKDFVSGAVSSDPHASLAWSGVCLLLPVSFKMFLSTRYVY
jgi:hypothetical protein